MRNIPQDILNRILAVDPARLDARPGGRIHPDFQGLAAQIGATQQPRPLSIAGAEEQLSQFSEGLPSVREFYNPKKRKLSIGLSNLGKPSSYRKKGILSETEGAQTPDLLQIMQELFGGRFS